MQARLRLGIVSLCVWSMGCVCVGQAYAAEPLSAKIDALLATTWQQAAVTPAPLCDDATFLRRVSLDLVGHIPLPADVVAFEQSTDPQKRQAVIARLLASPGYARHWAAVWRQMMLPQAETPQFAQLGPRFESWLQREFAENRPIDQVVAATLVPRQAERASEVAAASLLSAAEFKPENLAAHTARAYLGLNIDCAQCHDHPFSSWSQKQFWNFAALFAKPAAAEVGKPLTLSLMVPNSELIGTPELLNGGRPTLPEVLLDDSGRQCVATWITAPENPFFARNIVNRVWAQLLGEGLVEPLDDLSPTNPSRHPQLHKALAESFIASGYDLKQLISAITATQAYQLSSAAPVNEQSADAQWFARHVPQGLGGERLFDSILIASGLPLAPADPDDPVGNAARRAFTKSFKSGRDAVTQRSILQALELMNGPLTDDALRGKTVVAVAESPWLDARGRLQALFMATLSRQPTAMEEQELLPLVQHSDSQSRRQGLADLYWVLLNSAEFSVNH